MKTSGYSGKPLAQKLVLKEGHRIATMNAPPELPVALGPLPDEIEILGPSSGEADLVLLFSREARTLETEFARAVRRIRPAGMIWVAWPKRASKVSSDLTEDRESEIGLALGFVDVKVCAMADVWSGLEFVRRLKDR